MNGKRERGDPASHLGLAPRSPPPRTGGSREQIAKAIMSALSYQLTAADNVLAGGETRIRICGRKRSTSTDQGWRAK